MTTGTMQALLESKDPKCVDYHYDGQDRTVCAMGTEIFSAGGAVVNIVGFHHVKDNYSLIEKDNPNCNDPLYSLPVTAKQINEEQDLESKEEFLVEYVKALADRFKKRSGGIALTVVPRRFRDTLSCRRTCPGQHAGTGTACGEKT